MLRAAYNPTISSLNSSSTHFLVAFAKFRIDTISIVMSVRPSVHLSAWSNSVPTEQSSLKFYIWVFFENLSRKFTFHYDLTKMTVILHIDQYTLLIISRLVLHTIRSVSNKTVEKIKTHVLCSVNFSENCVVYEIIWKNRVDADRPHVSDNIMLHRKCPLHAG